MKIAIIGAGHVGGALGKGWAKAGHSIIFGVRSPGQGKTQPPLAAIGAAATSLPVPDAIRAADLTVLATPWEAVQDLVTFNADNLRGKVLVDCTNPLSLNGDGSLSLSVGFTSSGAEEIERWAPGAQVAKAFNTYGWENFADSAYPGYGNVKPAMFFGTDSEEARAMVAQLAVDLGFEPIHTGGLGMARSLEPLALMWIRLAIRDGRNPNFTWARLQR